MTNPHDKVIEAAAEALLAAGWEAVGETPEDAAMIARAIMGGISDDSADDARIARLAARAAIAAYERAMWRPKINWEDAEDPIVKLLVQYPVDEFVAEYEYGEDGYVPDESERALIEDAIYGFITDLHEKMRAALPLPPAPEGE